MNGSVPMYHCISNPVLAPQPSFQNGFYKSSTSIQNYCYACGNKLCQKGQHLKVCNRCSLIVDQIQKEKIEDEILSKAAYINQPYLTQSQILPARFPYPNYEQFQAMYPIPMPSQYRDFTTNDPTAACPMNPSAYLCYNSNLPFLSGIGSPLNTSMPFGSTLNSPLMNLANKLAVAPLFDDLNTQPFVTTPSFYNRASEVNANSLEDNLRSSIHNLKASIMDIKDASESINRVNIRKFRDIYEDYDKITKGFVQRNAEPLVYTRPNIEVQPLVSDEVSEASVSESEIDESAGSEESDTSGTGKKKKKKKKRSKKKKHRKKKDAEASSLETDSTATDKASETSSEASTVTDAEAVDASADGGSKKKKKKKKHRKHKKKHGSEDDSGSKKKKKHRKKKHKKKKD